LEISYFYQVTFSDNLTNVNMGKRRIKQQGHGDACLLSNEDDMHVDVIRVDVYDLPAV